MQWYGDKVVAELRRVMGQNLTRAAIHLTRRVKENLSVSGRQTGVVEADIDRTKIVREGRDERGRKSVTVTQREFHRIANPINAAKKARVKRTVRRRRKR